MTWHPPIPAGLATDPAVHKLQYKTAVILLIYCYDSVRRDGRVTINLKEAAAEIQEPYETVRRWWRELRNGPFFCEQIDRGRIGWDVKFSDEWIDWHVLSNNFQRSQVNGKEPSIHSSINFERSSMNADDPAYKVLISTDQAESVDELEDRDGTARSLSHPAMKTLAKHFPKLELDAKQIRSICSTATDGTVWRSVVELFADNGWQPLIGNLLDRYRKMLKEHSQSNGKTERVAPTVGMNSRPAAPHDAQPAQQTAAKMKALLERTRDNNVS